MRGKFPGKSHLDSRLPAPLCGVELGFPFNDWCVLLPNHEGDHACRDGHTWKKES